LRDAEDKLDWQVEFDGSYGFWGANGDHGLGVVCKNDAAWFAQLLVLFAVLLHHGEAVVDEELVEGGGRDGADFGLGGGADPVCAGEGELESGWFPIAGRS